MPPLIPLNFFAIPFGILGLADCWLVAADFDLAPVGLGRVMVALAVALWLIVLVAYLVGIRGHRKSLASQLADPVAGPFASLALITPMLAAADALYPLDHTTGTVVVDVLIAMTLLLGGWFTGQWFQRPVPLATLHSGYFLPTVAGGLVASASAALVGQTGLAEILLGLGLLSWIVVGAVLFGRLALGPPLPDPLLPSTAIMVAPAAVATFAAFVIDGHRVDTAIRLLAGYGLLMVVVQLRLLPAYLRLPFMPSFWAFTFSWASVAFAGLFWLGVTQPSGWRVWSYLALGLISVLIVAIAARTVVALRRGELLKPPAPPARPAAPGPLERTVPA